VLLDANLLLYAVDAESPRHDAAATWLTTVLNGEERIALPWQTLGAFLRISTHPRVTRNPLTAAQAWSFASDWLACETVWVPPATERTAVILGRLLVGTPATGNLVTDAQLAALAIENGLVVATTDTDFAHFDEVRWIDPLREPHATA
jgi:toxin-antitoxin system PIN domain toxin